MGFKNNYLTALIMLVLIFVTGSCKSSPDSAKADTSKVVLERGKPIDLDKINFQQADLDKLFAKLAYVKSFKLGEDHIKYTKDQPLVIHPYILYNITEPRIVNRYAKKEAYTISKGQLYADTVMIDRSVPLIGMKDADLRALGYWGAKDILFNQIFTSSTKNNKLIRLRLESNGLQGVTVATYKNLLAFLKAKYKHTPVKVHPQGDRESSYEWRTKERVIYISFNKDEELAYITMMVSFINADTKGLLPEFGH